MKPNNRETIVAISEDNGVFSSLMNIASAHCDFYVAEHDEFSEDALITTIVAPDVSSHTETSSVFEYIFKGVVGEKPEDGLLTDIHHQHFKVTVKVFVTEEPCPDTSNRSEHHATQD